MRLNNKIIGGLAAAAVAALPVAAQAGTRPGDAAVRAAPVAQAVTSDAGYAARSVSEENRVAGAGLIIAILAAVAVIVGIIIAADDDDNLSDG